MKTLVSFANGSEYLHAEKHESLDMKNEYSNEQLVATPFKSDPEAKKTIWSKSYRKPH